MCNGVLLLFLVEPPGGDVGSVYLICKSGDSLINSGMCCYPFMTCDLFIFVVKVKRAQGSTSESSREGLLIDERIKEELHVNNSFFFKQSYHNASQYKVLLLYQADQLSDRDYCWWMCSRHCTACPLLLQSFCSIMALSKTMSNPCLNIYENSWQNNVRAAAGDWWGDKTKQVTQWNLRQQAEPDTAGQKERWKMGKTWSLLSFGRVEKWNYPLLTARWCSEASNERNKSVMNPVNEKGCFSSLSCK